MDEAGSWAAFWLVAAFASASPAYEWAPAAAAAAAAWWAVAYAAAALFGGASCASVALAEPEDAVLHLDLAAASGAPVLSAMVAWWAGSRSRPSRLLARRAADGCRGHHLLRCHPRGLSPPGRVARLEGECISRGLSPR